MDVFYEESAKITKSKAEKKIYYTFNFFSILFFCLAGIILIIGFSVFRTKEISEIILDFVFQFIIPAVVSALIGLFLFFFKSRFHVEYDYTFINGTIKFSKIIMNKKRKHILTFDTENIEKIGKKDSELYKKFAKIPKIKNYVLTKNSNPVEGKGFYYIIVNKNSIKYLFTIECSEKFLVNIIKIIGKQVLDKDFL